MFVYIQCRRRINVNYSYRHNVVTLAKLYSIFMQTKLIRNVTYQNFFNCLQKKLKS